MTVMRFFKNACVQRFEISMGCHTFMSKAIPQHRQLLNDLQVSAVTLFKLCHGNALMPCCPTFTDGLNLCPQLRRINPDSADIISCFTL